MPFRFPFHPPVNCHTDTQKYSRLRCLLRVKGLVIVFFIWAGLAILFYSEKYNEGRFKVIAYLLAAVISFEPTYIIFF